MVKEKKRKKKKKKVEFCFRLRFRFRFRFRLRCVFVFASFVSSLRFRCVFVAFVFASFVFACVRLRVRLQRRCFGDGDDEMAQLAERLFQSHCGAIASLSVVTSATAGKS